MAHNTPINMQAYTNCNGRLSPADLLTNASVSTHTMGSYPERAGLNTDFVLCNSPLVITSTNTRDVL